MREPISAETTQVLNDVWNTMAKIPEIQSNACEKLIRSQSQWIDLWMEYGCSQLKTLEGRPDLRENLEAQSELVSELVPKLFDCAVSALDIVIQANTELCSCMAPAETDEAETTPSRETAGKAAPPAKSRRTTESAAA